MSVIELIMALCLSPALCTFSQQSGDSRTYAVHRTVPHFTAEDSFQCVDIRITNEEANITNVTLGKCPQ